MDQSTFDRFVRRSADLLNRRSLMVGMSGVLMAAGLVAHDAEETGGKEVEELQEAGAAMPQ